MTNRAEIESLTWLRGLAALVVVVSHSLRALEVRYHPADELPGLGALNAFDLGSLGVALFFVLSGCTLTLSNSRLSISSGQALTGFYAKRFSASGQPTRLLFLPIWHSVRFSGLFTGNSSGTGWNPSFLPPPALRTARTV